MKIRLHPQRATRGATLLFIAFFAIIIGAGLVFFLRNAQQEYNIVDRSQVWNSAMVLAEAGIEEGMTLINNGDWPNSATYSSDGWTLNGNVYSITRTLDTNIGYYTVYVTNTPAVPSICSIGSAYGTDANMNGDVLTRQVLVKTLITQPFPGALTLKSTVNFNGNNVTVDSYNSTDPFHSYWPNFPNGLGFGIYTNTGTTPNAVRKANGNVATDGAIIGIIDIGVGQVYGHVDTGPGGNTAISKNGSVGSVSWVDADTSGIEPGYSQDDMNVTFADVTVPSTNWTSLPNNANITNSGAYTMNQINDNITIGNGTNLMNVILYLTNGISFNGSRALTIGTNAYVTIYAGGVIADGGNGKGQINNSTQHASQLIILGLPSLTSINLHGNGAFWGAIYAPSAVVAFKGGGNTGGFYGALTAYSIVMTGNSTFSYDESLGTYGSTGYTVTSWQEVQ
jgi:hypothetical protein